MRVQYSETEEQDCSGPDAEQMYDALRAIYQHLPPGHNVESFSIRIDVTMKAHTVSATRRHKSLDTTPSNA